MNYENEMMFITLSSTHVKDSTIVLSFYFLNLFGFYFNSKTSFMIDKFWQSEYEDFISYFKNVIPFLNNFDLCFTKELTF